jgi:hypothetical protein
VGLGEIELETQLDGVIETEIGFFKANLDRLQRAKKEIPDNLPISKLICPYIAILTYLREEKFQDPNLTNQLAGLEKSTNDLECIPCNPGSPINLAIRYLAIQEPEHAAITAGLYDKELVRGTYFSDRYETGPTGEQQEIPSDEPNLFEEISDLMEFISNKDNAKLCCDLLMSAARAYDNVTRDPDEAAEFVRTRYSSQKFDGYADRFFAFTNDLSHIEQLRNGILTLETPDGEM